jgi:hypothetical protein
LKRALIFLLFTCTSCEAVLGFGETTAAQDLADVSTSNMGGHENKACEPSNVGAEGSQPQMVGSEPQDDGSVSNSFPVEVEASGKNASSEDIATAPDASLDVDSGDADERESDTGADERVSDTGSAWSPGSLSSLALWLDAAQSVTSELGKVSLWTDRSSHGLIAHQVNPSLQPSLLASEFGPYPGISFDNGAMLVVSDNPAIQFGTADFIIDVVVRHRTPTDRPVCQPWSYGAIFAKLNASVYPYEGPALFANMSFCGPVAPVLSTQLDIEMVFATRSKEGAYNDDVPRVVGVQRIGGALTLRINGKSMGSVDRPHQDGSPINASAIGSDLTIGAVEGRTQCLLGVIAEIVAASPVGPQEISDIENYLLHKYAAALGTH